MKALKILLDERKQQLDIFEQNKELGNPNENNYIVILNEAIKELEELETKDRLAELEKVILDYLTKEGFKIDDISCKFEIYLETQYKLKQIQVNFKRGVGFHSSNIFQTKAETTKEMFDKAFEYFSKKDTNAKWSN